MSETGQGDWQRVAVRFAVSLGLDARWGRVLDAFGQPLSVQPAPGAGAAEDFARLESRLEPLVGALPAQVVTQLQAEVDADQAHMFARRLQSVGVLLDRLGGLHPEGRLLRVGLWCRLAEVLKGPPPLAIRVRAVVDFYYSQGAVLQHRPVSGAPSPTLQQAVARLSWRRVHPGLEHALLEGPGPWGPLHVNLLRSRGLRIRTLDLRQGGPVALAAWGEQVAGRGQPLDFAQQVAALGGVAGVSGGFFLYSEPDIQPPCRRGDPVGLLMHRGQVLSPALFRRSALVQTASGRIGIERLGPAGRALNLGPIKVRIDAANDPGQLGRGTVAFTRAFGPVAPAFEGASVVVAAGRVVELAVGQVTIPVGGVVLSLDPRVNNPWPGMEARWLTPSVGGVPVLEAMAGGPRLVEAGQVAIDREAEDFVASAPPITFSADETFDQNLLPRMAAGLTGDGALLFAAVDGRNLERAPGLTLQGTAQLMVALGCERAMNLDGGSSKRMAVEGRVVDLASTEVVAGQGDEKKVRVVRSAVVLG